MSKDNGGPAFPVSGSEHNYPIEGMTLRDYFAAKAMQGIMANQSMIDDASSSSFDWVASKSYSMADAMLKARDK